MMMQRIAGLFCAVSIASLLARYMSCVIAFFFSGRRSLMMRLASSSVTIRWLFMVRRPSEQAARQRRWRYFAGHPTSSRRAAKTGDFPVRRRGGDAGPREQAMQLTGIHHLTAISAQPRDNLAFYSGLLGMRLVKKTVNQDDVRAYHLFYADAKATPGTDLPFFDFPA